MNLNSSPAESKELNLLMRGLTVAILKTKASVMRKFLIRCIVLLISFFCHHYSSHAQNGIVKGKVTHNNEVLSGATISLANRTILSDARGEFVFSMKPGKYLLTVSYVGYNTVQNEVNIIAGGVQDFEIILKPVDKAENVIVVGSRSAKERSNLNTPVPVDVIRLSTLPDREIALTKIIENNIPSFNVAPHGFREGKQTLPASLRGLSPERTLVLLNGKRLHTLASPWTFGVISLGGVGTDLNAIPMAAIESIEVLRDGASAQYGSDAIAGVINLKLKKSTGRTSIQLHTGQYYKGDGESVSFSINSGFTLLKKGYLNLTAQSRFNNYTQRNGEYNGTVYYNIPNTITQRQKDSIRTLDNQKNCGERIQQEKSQTTRR